MNDFRLRRGGCLLWIMLTLIAIGLSINSISYQRSDPFCYNLLGAGFPLSFICDVAGSSPTGSWGKIDDADYFNLNLGGLLADIVVYAGLLWVAWNAVLAFYHLMRRGIQTR
ncbi:MAG: hypothetical protein M3Z04_18810 [Chloroflexota bacterium]|nr:hypothetical protein [Chloroflexota bacterium]